MSTRASAWLAWSLAGLSVAIFVAGLALAVLARAADVPSSWSTSLTVSGMLVSVPFLAFPIVGALIASRRPYNVIGWICVADGLLWMLLAMIDYYGLYGVAEPGSVPFPAAIYALSEWLWVPTVGLVGIYLILLFPDGKLPSRRWRPLAWLSGAVIVFLGITGLFGPAPLPGLGGVRNPFGLEAHPWVTNAFYVVLPLLPLCMLASAVSLVLRYRGSGGEVRQQIKWIAFAASIVGLVYLLVIAAAFVLGPETTGTADASPFWFDFLSSVAFLSFAAVPVAVGIAILKYRLYNIDVVINRTLVYGGLTLSVVGIYVLIVGYLGALFRTSGNLFVSLIATGLVAVLFAPLHDRLQRAVNRMMYGERDDPYAVLSRLGRRLEATLAAEATLGTIVETVAETLKLPYAGVTLRRGDRFEAAAEHGEPVEEPLVLPLTYGPETVGQLVLAPRGPGESFTKSDLRLLEDLARQVGVAAHAVRLTADLQRSRERLVTAREEERRRLRRDLHDGVGPQLAALTLKIETARNKLAHDASADALLSDLAERARAAVADVRRSVHALRPPALDELGLIPALSETAAQYSQNSLSVEIKAPEDLPPLPAAVEVAAYRIAQEALTNVVRHAAAHSCAVRFDLDESARVLLLEVEDDGRGVGVDRGTGVGFSYMRERAEELGGTCVVEAVSPSGTRVNACLPLEASGIREKHRAGRRSLLAPNER